MGAKGTIRQHGSSTIPMVAQGMPRIPVHNSASIHASMPDFATAEKPRTGVAGIKGDLTAPYPVIAGLNAGPKNAIQQPMVTSTSNLKGFL
jgi:hypothetical protein